MGKSVEISHDRLITEGIDYLGYGQIAKAVMKDKRLSIGAKALYSYICSYAGAGDTAWPGRELICSDLNINKGTYTKYLKELKTTGYIKVTQKVANGRFGGNIYIIVKSPTPVEDTAKIACTEAPCTEKPYTVKSDSVNPDSEFSYSEIPDAEFPDSNKNSICNINSLKKELMDKEINRASNKKLSTEITNPDPKVLIKTWSSQWNVSEDVIRNRLFALHEQIEKGAIIDDIESYLRTSVENYLKGQAVLDYLRPHQKAVM
jgi:hypothetical protein